MSCNFSIINRLDPNSNSVFESFLEDGIFIQDMYKEEMEKKEEYRQRAIKAYKQGKIFIIYGNYITIRKALLRRGWIEKCTSKRIKQLEELSLMQLIRAAKKGNEYEKTILSKFVQAYPPNFIWQPKYLKVHYMGVTPLRNRVRRGRCMDFSTKVGLIGCYDDSHWNTIANVAEISVMPSHKLKNKEDQLNFSNDFRITQCISLLLYLIEYNTPSDLFDKFGSIPVSVIEFAIHKIEHNYKTLEEGNIEAFEQNGDGKEWNFFEENSLLMLKNNEKFIGSQTDCCDILIKTQQAISNALKLRPLLFSYGYRNLWILKPGFQCRGQGIKIMNNLYDVLNFATKNSKSNYVVQKYIERPFLIYQTKFDIRQYIILTIFDVISIWIYKDCYLKFSSKEFDLDDLREVIHITNNSVQKKYKNMDRDQRLPMCNMWSLSKFQSFLNEQGEEQAWRDTIYPGFKKNIISVVLSSLEETELTANSFEIYGCDFMLNEKLEPILIEINATPDMSPSTPVTAKICPSALDDLIKVVLDRPRNLKIPTGNFELIYQIKYKIKCNNSSDLIVTGSPKKLHTSHTTVLRKRKNKFELSKSKNVRKLCNK